MMRAISVASGLGTTSAYTWLKVPVVPDMERVMAASTLPALLLGGEVPDDPESAYAGWRKALRLPNVKGLVAGRSLLYPADDDVATAVDTAVSLLLSGGPAVIRRPCCYPAALLLSGGPAVILRACCSRVAGRRTRWRRA
jgi:hypothetical protein